MWIVEKVKVKSAKEKRAIGAQNKEVSAKGNGRDPPIVWPIRLRSGQASVGGCLKKQRQFKSNPEPCGVVDSGFGRLSQ
jgi:hypothetical protein